MASRPQDAPPDYQTATSTGNSQKTSKSTFLEVPQAHNGIPAASRRSMEDEQRPLPPGWIRQFDVKNNHQFFVDTKADTPRSIWVHPYDDEQFLSTLSSEERERIQAEEQELREQKGPISGISSVEHTEDEADLKKPAAAGFGTSQHHPDLPPRPGSTSTPHKREGFSDRMKHRLTGMTKEERQRVRAEFEEEEKKAYEAHMRYRECMQRAEMTGQPQFFAKNVNGEEIWIEPSYGPRDGYQNGYGVNPYQGGPYANPQARFIRPAAPYGRPYGPYRGGGYGLPVAGGLLGGMLLGGLLF